MNAKLNGFLTWYRQGSRRSLTLFGTLVLALMPCVVQALIICDGDAVCVTPSAGPHGTIYPSTLLCPCYGDTWSFTVTPDPGYTASVGGTCGGTLVGTTYTTAPLTYPCTVVASFTPVIYDKVGYWRPSDGRFRLDTNGNDKWDGTAGGDTLTNAFGTATDIPVAGDWTGDGSDEVGYWRPSDCKFRLDTNGNGKWDGTAGGDTLTGAFGTPTDLPVVGDWNGDGTDEVGFWRPSDRKFRLDTNGNDIWNGPAGGDTLTAAFGTATDLPVVGDWNGDGTDEVGFWRPSDRKFRLDTNGNGKWDGAAGGDTLTGVFGEPTDRPAVGAW